MDADAILKRSFRASNAASYHRPARMAFDRVAVKLIGRQIRRHLISRHGPVDGRHRQSNYISFLPRLFKDDASGIISHQDAINFHFAGR